MRTHRRATTARTSSHPAPDDGAAHHRAPRRARTLGLAAAAATALILAACGGGDDDPEAGGDGVANSAEEATEPIVIGVFHGWEEGIATSHLWARILQDQGYEVELEYGDVSPVFIGLADGDYHLNFDTALPYNHAPYMEEYGDDLESLGVWYPNYPNLMAVNEDAPITSLDELAEHAEDFDNRIVAIEPGAGLTRLSQEEVVPAYGLEDMEFVISSTPAMLAELTAAIDRGDNIVVTLWKPHWAFSALPIRELEDPLGAFGEPNDLHVMANADFSTEFPEVAGWMNDFVMHDDQIAALEDIMFNELDGQDNDEAVDRWLAENPDFVDSLLSGELAAELRGEGADGDDSGDGAGEQEGSDD